MSNLPPDAIPLSYQACQKFGEGTETFDRGLITSSWGSSRVISHIDCIYKSTVAFLQGFFPINPSNQSVFFGITPFPSDCRLKIVLFRRKWKLKWEQ